MEFIAGLNWSKFNLRKLLLVLTCISFAGFIYFLVEISNLSPGTIGLSLLLSPLVGLILGLILGMILFGIFNLFFGLAFIAYLFGPLFKRIILWFFKLFRLKNAMYLVDLSGGLAMAIADIHLFLRKRVIRLLSNNPRSGYNRNLRYSSHYK